MGNSRETQKSVQLNDRLRRAGISSVLSVYGNNETSRCVPMTARSCRKPGVVHIPQAPQNLFGMHTKAKDSLL